MSARAPAAGLAHETLFCARSAGTPAVGDTPEAAARAAGLSCRLDPLGLHGYLCFSYVPAPHSILAGVSAIAPGRRMAWEDSACGRVGVSVPTPAPLTMEPGTPDSAGEPPRAMAWRERPPLRADIPTLCEELRGLLRVAVRSHVARAERVAVFLSGGLDSSLVAALLVEAGVRLELFTLDFGPPWDAELPYARAVAEHLRRPLHVVPARPAQVCGGVAPAAAALNQPFGDAVTVPLYLLGRAAADHADVAFNGEGGDQLFGGWANKPMVAGALYSGPDYDIVQEYLATFHRFHSETDALYTPAARARVGRVDAGAWLRPYLCAPGFGTLLHRLRAANLHLKGAQNILPRATQLAATHGLRMAAPLFDVALTEWTFGLAPEALLSGACEKYLLKRVADAFLPSHVVWRAKRGMGVPVTDWLLGPLRRCVGERLSAARLRRDGWFDPGYVAALRRGGHAGGEFRRRRLGEKLWLLYFLHVWMDVHGVSW